ncbi:hypothetical protein E2562_036692 [Oryza meyeriana var. granulata]|uniref:Uncharacterized protein n=1 Tax=Oryza meyeriana var. granulata TaxID=110450 RepID=A0A6G1DSU5_9ORYZ|nr:hypothetical protein E2562_036692 [Oryza meyeriana var. granulata]
MLPRCRTRPSSAGDKEEGDGPEDATFVFPLKVASPKQPIFSCRCSLLCDGRRLQLLLDAMSPVLVAPFLSPLHAWVAKRPDLADGGEDQRGGGDDTGSRRRERERRAR